jgi:hypothetical protein
MILNVLSSFRYVILELLARSNARFFKGIGKWWRAIGVKSLLCWFHLLMSIWFFWCDVRKWNSSRSETYINGNSKVFSILFLPKCDLRAIIRCWFVPCKSLCYMVLSEWWVGESVLLLLWFWIFWVVFWVSCNSVGSGILFRACNVF